MEPHPAITPINRHPRYFDRLSQPRLTVLAQPVSEPSISELLMESRADQWEIMRAEHELYRAFVDWLLVNLRALIERDNRKSRTRTGTTTLER